MSAITLAVPVGSADDWEREAVSMTVETIRETRIAPEADGTADEEVAETSEASATSEEAAAVGDLDWIEDR